MHHPMKLLVGILKVSEQTNLLGYYSNYNPLKQESFPYHYFYWYRSDNKIIRDDDEKCSAFETNLNT